jgi:endonuclease-3
MAGLCALPGVARKTANVVLGNALHKNEGIVVDTHVLRVAARLGLTRQVDPGKTEDDLMALIPRERWTDFGNQMIHHGRYLCRAKDPQCEQCPLAPVCPSAGLGVIMMKKQAPKRQPRTPAAPKPKLKIKVKAKRR